MTRPWKSPNGTAEPQPRTGIVDAIRTHSLSRIKVFVLFCKLKPLLVGEARDGCFLLKPNTNGNDYHSHCPPHMLFLANGVSKYVGVLQPRVIPPHLQQKASSSNRVPCRKRHRGVHQGGRSSRSVYRRHGFCAGCFSSFQASRPGYSSRCRPSHRTSCRPVSCET